MKTRSRFIVRSSFVNCPAYLTRAQAPQRGDGWTPDRPRATVFRNREQAAKKIEKLRLKDAVVDEIFEEDE